MCMGYFHLYKMYTFTTYRSRNNGCGGIEARIVTYLYIWFVTLMGIFSLFPQFTHAD